MKLPQIYASTNNNVQRIPSSGMLSGEATLRTDVSEECIITVFLLSVLQLLLIANVVLSSLVVPLLMESKFLPKRRFLEVSHDFTFQMTAFFIVTAVKTSNLRII
jgi:hypothetical protein